MYTKKLLSPYSEHVVNNSKDFIKLVEVITTIENILN